MNTPTFVEEILSHHGVLGMKWGHHSSSSESPTKIKVQDRGKKLRTSGGKGHPASADAIRARTIQQRGKASGLKSLSDKELIEYTKRLSLEQNALRLNYADKNPAQKFVATLLGQAGKASVQTVANDVASYQVKKHLGAHLIRMGAAAA